MLTQYGNDKLVAGIRELRLKENGNLDSNIDNDTTDALRMP